MDVNAADVHMWEIGGPDIEPASFTEKVKLMMVTSGLRLQLLQI